MKVPKPGGHQPPRHLSPLLLLLSTWHVPLRTSLLLQIRLHPPLPRLPIRPLPLRLLLLPLIPHQTRNRTPDRPTDPISQTLPQIRQLALRLLSFTFLILPDALLLQAFGADQVANALLGRADRLVP